MKQMNVLNWRSGMNMNGFAKSLGLTVICLVFIFMFGAYDSSAQTKDQLGDSKSTEVISRIQQESRSIELERKNSGSANIEFNDQITRYYANVINSFKAGEDIKKAFLNVEVANTSNQNSGSANAEMNPNTVIDPNSNEMKGLQQVVENLNLYDNNFADLVAVFNYWRTVKNQ